MTFLFTDIEGSTRLWERHPATMPDVIQRHDALIDRAVSGYGGAVFHRAGDGVIASFGETTAAVEAAIEIQRRLVAEDWSAVGALGVRIGIHRGEVVLRDGAPFGWALNYGARFCALGQGGQVLLSESAVLALPADRFELRHLGAARLRDIAPPASVFQLVVADLPSEFAPLRDAGRRRPLPTPPNAMIGRGDELGRLGVRLGADRLVTVVGPPGVGKSRLVVELANSRLDSYPNGAHLCSLGGVDADRALDAVVTTLGVSTRPGRTVEQSLIDWLTGQQLLLVLDDCERALDRVADLVRAILASATSVTVVCTSHRPLGIAGESLFRLAPLPPDDAVELFIDRTADSGIPIERSDDLHSLCDQLDRLPFAIEVAAAQASLYSVNELRELLGDRAPEAESGPQAALRSLADALAIGFDALPADRRSMLVAATSFAGAFDRAAFHEVCAPDRSPADAAAGLTDLVDRSLISAETVDGPTQFRLLHGAHDFVTSRSEPAERALAADRFHRWVRGFVHAGAVAMRGPDEAAWNRRIGQHFDNIRSGYGHALDEDLDACVDIVTALWDYAFMRMNVEYFRWSQSLLERFGDDDTAGRLGPVYGVAALGAWFRDDLDAALGWAERALQLERDHDLPFDLPARLALINAAIYSGANAPPEDIYAETAHYERSRAEAYFAVSVETNNSIMATWLGDTDAALRRGVRAVRLARESGNPSSLAFALWGLGSALETDDPFHAEAQLGSALSIARDVENLWITALVQMSLASLRRRASGAFDAAPILLDLLDLLSRASHRSHLWHTLRLCALVLGDLGDDETAAQLSAWLRHVELAMPSLPVDQEAGRAQDERIRTARGDAWLDRVELLTATWTTETAVAVARTALRHHVEAAEAADAAG